MKPHNTDESKTGVHQTRRRKNPYPKRGIFSPQSEEERMKLGIIKLNAVDDMYRKDPKRLFELGTLLEHHLESEYLPQHSSDKPTTQLLVTTPPINRHLAAKCKVHWKGTALDISQHPLYNTLLPEEAEVASTLRLKPDQYLTIKRVILHESRLKEQFRKTDAQRMCRVDVNKTGKIWDWFHDIGWLSDPTNHHSDCISK